MGWPVEFLLRLQFLNGMAYYLPVYQILGMEDGQTGMQLNELAVR